RLNVGLLVLHLKEHGIANNVRARDGPRLVEHGSNNTPYCSEHALVLSDRLSRGPQQTRIQPPEMFRPANAVKLWVGLEPFGRHSDDLLVTGLNALYLGITEQLDAAGYLFY
ncbi:hypothetical protein CMUS01_16133, partial [Colletotrichum musicola]